MFVGTHSRGMRDAAPASADALFLRRREKVGVVQELDGARCFPHLQLSHQARPCPVEQRQVTSSAGDSDVSPVGCVI